jgi:hypothetical protein
MRMDAMITISRTGSGYNIEKDGVLAEVGRLKGQILDGKAVFVVLGVFTLYSNLELLPAESRIMLFEAEDVFRKYLRPVENCKKFTGLKVMPADYAAELDVFFNALSPSDAENIKVLRDRGIYGFNSASYADFLRRLNAHIKKKKNEVPGFGKATLENIDRAIGFENGRKREALILAKYILQGD